MEFFNGKNLIKILLLLLIHDFIQICLPTNFLGDKVTTCDDTNHTIYNYTMTTLEGAKISLTQFHKMIVLVVNVASFCRFTPQYLQLNELMNKYGGDIQLIDSSQSQSLNSNMNMKPSNNSKFCKLQILGFPTNLFYKKEPGYDFEIKNCLYYVRPGNRFVPNFPLSSKIDVNGIQQIPLYTFLKENCHTNANLVNDMCASWTPIHNNDITWNFEKFLINHNGHPIYRFQPMVEPLQLTDYIQSLIKTCNDEIYHGTLIGTLDLNNTIYEQYMGPKSTNKQTTP